MDFFQNNNFKEPNNMTVAANSWVMISMLKKYFFQLSHGIWNVHWTKLHQWYTHLGKNFCQLLLLKVCETFEMFSDRVKKLRLYFGLYFFFAFLEKRRPNRYCLQNENLVFYLKMFNLICQSIIFLAREMQ